MRRCPGDRRGGAFPSAPRTGSARLDIEVRTTDEDRGLAGPHRRRSTDDRGVDQATAGRNDVGRERGQEVGACRAHLDEQPSSTFADSAVRPEVGGPHGLRTGQAADHHVGAADGRSRRVGHRANAQRLGALSGPVPEGQLEAAICEPACDRRAHLAGSEDRDPGGALRARALAGITFGRRHVRDSFVHIFSGAGPPTGISSRTICSIWARSCRERLEVGGRGGLADLLRVAGTDDRHVDGRVRERPRDRELGDRHATLRGERLEPTDDAQVSLEGFTGEHVVLRPPVVGCERRCFGHSTAEQAMGHRAVTRTPMPCSWANGRIDCSISRRNR